MFIIVLTVIKEQALSIAINTTHKLHLFHLLLMRYETMFELIHFLGELIQSITNLFGLIFSRLTFLNLSISLFYYSSIMFIGGYLFRILNNYYYSKKSTKKATQSLFFSIGFLCLSFLT